MSTKYLYYSYLQTEYKKINLTAYSDKDINAWKTGSTRGIRGTRYAKLLKDASNASTPTQRTDHGNEGQRVQAG